MTAHSTTFDNLDKFAAPQSAHSTTARLQHGAPYVAIIRYIRFGKSIHPKWDPQLTATAFWLYLPTRGEIFAEHHLQQAVMSPRCLFQLPRLPTEEELLSATPQLPLPASTPQALSVSELLSEQFLILTNGHSLAIVSGVPQFRNNALQILAASKLNQSRCQQVTSAWVLELRRFATGFCTVTVENTCSKPRPPKLH